MRIIIDSSGVGYLREAKMRLNNKSHLLKTGLTTIQRNYSMGKSTVEIMEPFLV